MTQSIQSDRKTLRRFQLWARRNRLNRKLAYLLAGVSVLAGIATVATMTGSAANGPDPKTILGLLYLDAVLLILLGAVVTRRLVGMWMERRRGQAGSGLHIKLVMLFALVAVTPAILVAVFSALFLNFGLQAWFSERVSTALEESNQVASAYLQEHRKTIRADVSTMANDLNRNATVLVRNRLQFEQYLSSHAAIRSLPEAVVVDSSGRIMARSALSLSLAFDLVTEDAIEKANKGQIVVLTTDQDDRVRAVVKLDRFADAYLLVGRFVDSSILEHIDRTERAVAQYQSLEKRRKSIQITFVMIFVVVALLLLLAAVWIGITLADQLASPIIKLISAADKVGKGDLKVRVNATRSSDEIGTLGRAFNRMTSEIESQQHGLIEANRELDERRRFTETVLSGVSAGVIGLDDKGRINLPNRSASELLETALEQSIGKNLTDVVPEMAELLSNIIERPDRTHQSELKIIRHGHVRTLLAAVASERLQEDIIGYVVTFDDVSELLSAQRKAAWADVARRIAHEIKNPLTPIQLSAERLKRKYLKEITGDTETFSTCIDTIIRQVEDIGRMVDEFSSFARMPQPTLKNANLSEICRQSVFLECNRYPEIEFKTDYPEDDIHFLCDSRQVGRALTNILKNAAESVTTQSRSEKSGFKGKVGLSLLAEGAGDDTRISIVIEDNGIGLPKEHRERLTEPYVTTRDKGTGLGLAIVKKILEDHNGELILADHEERGARISLKFRSINEIKLDDENKNADQSDSVPLEAHGS